MLNEYSNPAQVTDAFNQQFNDIDLDVDDFSSDLSNFISGTEDDVLRISDY